MYMPNKALRTLYLYNGLFVFATGMFGPLYALYVQKISDNVVLVSTSWSVFLVAVVLGTFIVSKFGDTVKEKEYLLIAGYFLRAIVWISYIFVTTIPMLMILQVVLGIAESLGSPAFGALVSEHLDKDKFIKEYSDMNIIFSLSGALATMLGGFIVARYDFPTLFIIMAAIAFIASVGLIIKPRKLL